MQFIFRFLFNNFKLWPKMAWQDRQGNRLTLWNIGNITSHQSRSSTILLKISESLQLGLRGFFPHYQHRGIASFTKPHRRALNIIVAFWYFANSHLVYSSIISALDSISSIKVFIAFATAICASRFKSNLINISINTKIPWY